MLPRPHYCRNMSEKIRAANYLLLKLCVTSGRIMAVEAEISENQDNGICFLSYHQYLEVLGILILLAALFIILFGLILGIICHCYVKEVVNFKATVLVSCSCKCNDLISCKYHDPLLLRQLSDIFPSYDDMVRLGLYLGIKKSVIQQCMESKQNHTLCGAVYDMLCHKWFSRQDGLSLRSKGLNLLSQAMYKSGIMQIWRDILEEHFQERLGNDENATQVLAEFLENLTHI